MRTTARAARHGSRTVGASRRPPWMDHVNNIGLVAIDHNLSRQGAQAAGEGSREMGGVGLGEQESTKVGRFDDSAADGNEALVCVFVSVWVCDWTCGSERVCMCERVLVFGGGSGFAAVSPRHVAPRSRPRSGCRPSAAEARAAGQRSRRRRRSGAPAGPPPPVHPSAATTAPGAVHAPIKGSTGNGN